MRTKFICFVTLSLRPYGDSDDYDSGLEQPLESEGTSDLNSPELDSDGKARVKAISSAKQAKAFADRLEHDGRKRNALNGEINAVFSGKLPFDQEKMAESGQKWRSNFPTKPMAPPVDRAVTQAVDYVSSSPMLTNSRLPGNIINAKEKTDNFRRITTGLIRQWTDWNDFLSITLKENFLIGYAVSAWLDDDWRPRLYRSDEVFFPDGVGQTPGKVSGLAFREDYLIHEFYEQISDRKAAEAAGWHYENCIEAINNAKVDNDEHDRRDRADAAREVNLSDSYANGTKTVNLWVVVCAEVNGKCSLWVVTREEGKLIRHVDEYYDSMDDVLGMFTISVGNGRFYGSMGMGRVLLNVANALDRARCMAMDQMFLSGLVVVTTEGRSANNVSIRVNHPFIIVSDEKATVSSVGFNFDHSAFQAMDSRLQSLIEELAGVYIPRKVDPDGKSITATQAQIDASREEAVKQGVFNRMWNQLSGVISAMQRKIYSEDNLKEARRQYDKYKEDLMIEDGGLRGSFVFFKSKAFAFIKNLGDTVGVFKRPETDGLADTEAVEAIINLFSLGLSEKEILMLAHSPAADISQDAAIAREQASMMWLESNVENPMIDQVESLKYRAQIVLGEELSERMVMTEDRDMQLKAAQYRQQQIELTSIMAHQPIPVVDTDDHAVHQKVIRDTVGVALFSTPIEAVTPDYLNAMKIAADHHLAHTQKRIMLGQSPDDMPEEIAFDEEAQKLIAALEQRVAEVDGGMPIPVNLTPEEQAAAEQQFFQ